MIRIAQVLLTLLLTAGIVNFGLKPGFASFMLALGASVVWFGGMASLWIAQKVHRGAQVAGKWIQRLGVELGLDDENPDDKWPKLQNDRFEGWEVGAELLRHQSKWEAWHATVSSGRSDSSQVRAIAYGLRLIRELGTVAISYHDLLRERLNPDELTYSRYMGAAEAAIRLTLGQLEGVRESLTHFGNSEKAQRRAEENFRNAMRSLQALRTTRDSLFEMRRLTESGGLQGQAQFDSVIGDLERLSSRSRLYS